MNSLSVKQLIVTLLFMSIFISCDLATSNVTSSGFSQDPQTNQIEFHSNDPMDYQSSFIYSLETTESKFSSFEASVMKKSGYAYGDFGIVFCKNDSSYLAFVIDVKGNYRVFKNEGGVVKNLIDWTSTSALYQGYSVKNSLRIEMAASGIFNIVINNVQVDSFQENRLQSGDNGYFAFVASGNYEDLSSSPVEVVYEL